MYFKGLFLISVQKRVFLHCVTIIQLQKSERKDFNFTSIPAGIKPYTNALQFNTGQYQKTSREKQEGVILAPVQCLPKQYLKECSFSTQD